MALIASIAVTRLPVADWSTIHATAAAATTNAAALVSPLISSRHHEPGCTVAGLRPRQHVVADQRRVSYQAGDQPSHDDEWDVEHTDRSERHGMAPVQHQRGACDLTGPPPAHHRHGLDTLPRGSSDEEPREQGDDHDADQDAARRGLELDELDRAPLDHAAERVDHLRRLRIAGGDDERTVPQILVPVDRLGPASLAGRSGGTVVRVRHDAHPNGRRRPATRTGRSDRPPCRAATRRRAPRGWRVRR